MITAKTESGFSIELEDDALEDQELFDAISGMQDGNVFSMSHLTERLLGTEGRKKLYDHLRNDKGRVPPQAVAQAQRAVSGLPLFGYGPLGPHACPG